ncbi:MAG: hypothetical protein HRT36_02430 [Alphaproteobacteria bacterium]|nr:hypothetical protein [Alphaproteobacteria bacterium]
MPSGDRAKAKAEGAKWDPDMTSWFIPQHHLKNFAAFSKWPAGLPEGRTETFSHRKARNMGACEDQGLSLGD